MSDLPRHPDDVPAFMEGLEFGGAPVGVPPVVEAAATRAGHTYIVSMVRADRTYWMQAQALLDWAFALPASSTPVGQLVGPAAATSAPLPKGEEARLAVVGGGHSRGTPAPCRQPRSPPP